MQASKDAPLQLTVPSDVLTAQIAPVEVMVWRVQASSWGRCVSMKGDKGAFPDVLACILGYSKHPRVFRFLEGDVSSSQAYVVWSASKNKHITKQAPCRLPCMTHPKKKVWLHVASTAGAVLPACARRAAKVEGRNREKSGERGAPGTSQAGRENVAVPGGLLDSSTGGVPSSKVPERLKWPFWEGADLILLGLDCC